MNVCTKHATYSILIPVNYDHAKYIAYGNYLHLYTEIIIGFDPANYNVNESDGTVTLIVSVLEGTLSEEQSIPVRVITGDDSAQGKKQLLYTT